MKQFECINTFTSSKGEYYAKSAKIYESEYYQLSGSDKANFKEVYSDMTEFDRPVSKDDRFAGLTEGGIFEKVDDSFVDDIKDDIYGESGQEDFDFGGGDTGGAGASDDF
jgi:hypothetical protein